MSLTPSWKTCSTETPMRDRPDWMKLAVAAAVCAAVILLVKLIVELVA